MTTAAPSCALVTPSPRSTLAGRPAYPVSNTVVWRGGRRPLLNPRRLAPLPEQRTDGGRRPRTPHRCAPGGAAHRCGRRPRHAGGPGRLRRGAGPTGSKTLWSAATRTPAIRAGELWLSQTWTATTGRSKALYVPGHLLPSLAACRQDRRINPSESCPGGLLCRAPRGALRRGRRFPRLLPRAGRRAAAQQESQEDCGRCHPGC